MRFLEKSSKGGTFLFRQAIKIQSDLINVDSFYILAKFRRGNFSSPFQKTKLLPRIVRIIYRAIILIDKLLHFDINTPRRLIVRFRDKERYTNERRL